VIVTQVEQFAAYTINVAHLTVILQNITIALFRHTSKLEAFHNHLLMYAAKRYSYV
jgi:hypothetical protein